MVFYIEFFVLYPTILVSRIRQSLIEYEDDLALFLDLISRIKAFTPACIPAVAWTMTPTNLPWLTLSASGDNGNFVINGAVSANKGTYTLTVTATINGKQVTSTSTLTIACHVSSVDKTGTIANIIYF